MVSDSEPGTAPAARRWRWHWWHRRTPTTRRAIRGTLAIALTGLVSLVVGVFTASADSALGPHAAHYEVTPQHEIVVDLGPLGAVLLESPLPWPLGVRVVVEEIPVELAAVPASPVTGLAGDLAAYAQIFSYPEAAIADATTALVRDAVGRTMVVWSVLLGSLAVGRLASRGLLRREVAQAARRPGVVPLAGVVALTLVVLPVLGELRARPLEGSPISAFAGTPLAELRMTGRMAQLIDTYGGYLVDAVEENEAFYAAVSANLEVAYADSSSPRRPPGIPVVSPTPRDAQATPDAPTADASPGAPTAEASPGAPTTASPAAASTPGSGVEDLFPDSAVRADDEPAADEPPPRVEPVTLLLVSDLHCNVGMADVIAKAVELSGARVLLDAGDTVMSGTSVESYCVNAFAGAVPEDVPVVVSTGNHDSETTADQMRDAGYTVLDGDVTEVEGIHILGDTDPTLTAIGEGTRPEREETVAEMGSRLAQDACAEDRVDLLLVHNPLAALDTMAEGCVPLAVSGHWHRREGPEVVDRGVRYVSSSTAGAVSGGATIGPLGGTAEMTVLRVDASSGRPMDYRVISIGTDTSVELGRWYRFPAPPDLDAAGGEQVNGDTESPGVTEAPTDAEVASPAGTERR